jgi:3-dehydroquinate synthase
MIRLDFKFSNVYIVENLQHDLSELLNSFRKEKVFVLTDETAFKTCYPKIKNIEGVCEERTIVLKAGDDNKNIQSVIEVWKQLSNKGADRKSVLINLGGGMPTDLGGFVASTFKRGFKFINIPTTLLSQVDASVGGKTGFNFEGFKNEIGVFSQADAVLIDTSFLDTLDSDNLYSGFAEMIKHALIYSPESWEQLKAFNLENPNIENLKKLVAESIAIKEHFVETDPTEQGIRKALNFGHTVGHAIESFSLKAGRPILHGYAVAYGMICELYLSHIKLGFPLKDAEQISRNILKIFGPFPIDKKHDEALFELTLHDKKNDNGRINITLLEAPGSVKIDIDCNKAEIIESINFYRNLLK